MDVLFHLGQRGLYLVYLVALKVPLGHSLFCKHAVAALPVCGRFAASSQIGEQIHNLIRGPEFPVWKMEMITEGKEQKSINIL